MPSEVIISAIAKLFLVGATGFAAMRLHVLDERVIRGLSRYVTYLSLPCLIVETLGRVLQPQYAGWLVLCLAGGVAIMGAGLLIAYLVDILFLRSAEPHPRGLFVSLSSVHNSGYLPIPLVTAILPEAQQDEALLFTFMHIFIMGLLFWSLGVRLISGAAADSRENLRRIMNPPMGALLFSFIFFIPGTREVFSDLKIFQTALHLLGESTIPIVLIILGGSLAIRRDRTEPRWGIVFLSAGLRLLVVPGIVLAFLKNVPLEQIFAFTLMLQACMPAATNHIVVVQEYGGDAALTSRALLVQYLAAVVTVPIFLHGL